MWNAYTRMSGNSCGSSNLLEKKWSWSNKWSHRLETFKSNDVSTNPESGYVKSRRICRELQNFTWAEHFARKRFHMGIDSDLLPALNFHPFSWKWVQQYFSDLKYLRITKLCISNERWKESRLEHILMQDWLFKQHKKRHIFSHIERKSRRKTLVN